MSSVERAATWWRRPARAGYVYAAAAAIGLATYLVVYGWGHFVATTTYWQMPQQDERMAMMGYRYFLYGTWHFPVFVNDAVNVPYSKSVAFLDCIPIWALVNKLVATVIPPWEAFSARCYLGLWHGLVYALQAVFGVACLRALGHRTWPAAVVTAVFFVATPTWIARYGHAALSAHWVLLWALYLYLRTPWGCAPPRALGVVKLCQLAVAALVTPYLAVMSLSVYIPSLFRSRDRRTIATWLPLGVISVGLANWFAGYFAREARHPQWGFPHQSANLLSWLVPPRSGIVGDAQWIASVHGTPYQYEGYAYLGLGVLILLVLFARHARLLGAVVSAHRYLFAAVVVSCLFALSNHVYFGSHEIAAYPIPRLLRWIPGQFRAPGRFVWIPSYVLILFLLHWALTQFASARRFLVVVVAAGLQLIDATGDWRVQRAWTDGPRWPLLDLARWRPLVHAHDAVFVIPTYSCVEDENIGDLDYASMEIQLLASERALPINGTYSAREMRKCAAEEREWPALPLQPNALYVLLPQASAIATRFEAGGAHCGVFDRPAGPGELWRVCSTNERAMAEAARVKLLRPTAGPISLAYGQRLRLADLPAVAADWTAAEQGGRWTTTSVSSLMLHLDGPALPFGSAAGQAHAPAVEAEPPPPQVALKLQLRARLCGQRQVEDVDVWLDATRLGTLHLDAASNDPEVVRTIAIPDAGALRRPRLTVQIAPRDIRSPTKLGCAPDPRRLGVWVSQLWFEATP